METKEKYGSQKKYDAANTKQYAIKLNKKTDADLIAYLEDRERVASVQGAIKDALRNALGTPKNWDKITLDLEYKTGAKISQNVNYIHIQDGVLTFSEARQMHDLGINQVEVQLENLASVDVTFTRDNE